MNIKFIKDPPLIKKKMTLLKSFAKIEFDVNFQNENGLICFLFKRMLYIS